MPQIVTLTMNPAIDVSTSTPGIEPWRKLRCAPGRRDAGGGGINVARVARRLGADVTAVYPAGGFTGEVLQRLVAQEGITSVAVPVEGDTREDFTVLDEGRGEQYRFVLPGPRLRGTEWMQCLKTLAAITPTPDFVCASGSLPQGAPDDLYARVAEIVCSWGVPLALDASGAALARALDQHVFLIKPNLNEIRELAGSALEDEPSLVRACRDLIARGRVEVVALTLGAEGALLVTAERAWRAGPLPVQPISTVGTGDSFLGAMGWALAGGMPIEEAFRYGIAAGTAALMAPGTELARAEDVRRLMAQVSVQPARDQARAPA